MLCDRKMPVKLKGKYIGLQNSGKTSNDGAGTWSTTKNQEKTPEVNEIRILSGCVESLTKER